MDPTVRLLPIPWTLLIVLCYISPIHAVTFDWAYVGNAGNAADPETGYGAVAYEYAISKTEVTNAQYVAFLNAVAAIDDFGGLDPTLFDSDMEDHQRGGITRSGVSGSYTYQTKSNMANKPVNFVSFFDAMRFTNWLHNGQGNGGTETGAYTIGSDLDEFRSPNARYWIPSEDEWYKAAYHQPAAEGGDVDDYWLYPTRSNTPPTRATANSVGDISNPGSNVANFRSTADWNGLNGNVTTVGSAGPLSASFYGTFDQGGNVAEMNETVIDFPRRGTRGGAYNYLTTSLQSSRRGDFPPFGEDTTIGFRVATVPEPSTGLMGVLASLIWCSTRRR